MFGTASPFEFRFVSLVGFRKLRHDQFEVIDALLTLGVLKELIGQRGDSVERITAAIWL